MNITEIFSSGQSGMISGKYQKIVQALSWRQKYMKITILIKQIDNGEMKGLGTGTFVWPAAHVLSKYLEKSYGRMDSIKVCDLGSGTGITGLAAAALGANVTLTDQECLIFLLNENKNKNSLNTAYANIMHDRVSVEVYNWEDEIQGSDMEAHMPFDIVLVSDCVLPKLYPIDILLDGLVKVMGPATIALFSYEHRPFTQFDPRLEFKRLAEVRGLKVEQVPLSEHHDTYSCDDIEIWRVSWQQHASHQHHTSTAIDFCQSVEPLSWGDHEHSIPINMRTYAIDGQLNTIQVIIKQNIGSHSDDNQSSSDTIGSYLWLSSVIASRIVLSRSYQQLIEQVQVPGHLMAIARNTRPRVLELGAGCGLTTLALLLPGYDVISTDTASVIHILHHNISHGQSIINETISSIGSVHIHEVNWFEESIDAEVLQGSYDMIVCADCCYSSLAIIPLYNILRKVCTANTCILLVNELRSSWDEFLSYSRKQDVNIITKEIHLYERDMQISYDNKLLCATRPVQALVARFVF